MLGKKSHINHCYFLCLLDWRDFLLPKDQIDKVAMALGLPADPAEPTTGWHVGPYLGVEHEPVDEATVGIAHSRIIFDFKLKNVPLNNFWEIRRVRVELEDKVASFLEERALPAMQRVLWEWVRRNPQRGGPRIFVYPVFEVNSNEPFWKDLQEDKPFNIPTTCFHARLRDLQGGWRVLGGKTVKMRVSGAKIIATEMSNRFFWELVNVVYYQGLYWQSRESSQAFPIGRVHRSLENRLEDFGREFATTFYELVSARMLERLNFRLVVVTVFLVLLTVLVLVVAAATLIITASG